MAEYKCVQRLRTADGVIHELGTIVTLTGEEEQTAVRLHAVVPMLMTPQPTLQQLETEKAQIDQEIATMEHEGGATV